MDIDSPLGNLIKTIKQVVKSSTEYESRLMHNEAATRQTLINPILNALGWDLANPNMVEVEKTFKNTRLDYALMDSTGTVHIIIEAKALSGNLSDNNVLFALISYCLTYGISNLFLTNGLVWQHFTNLQPGNINPVTIDFLKEPLIRCASYLINEMDAARFWTLDIKPVDTWKPDTVKPVEPAQKPTVVESKPKLQGMTQPVQLDQAFVSDEFIPLSNLKGDLRGKPAPKQLRLPNGSVKQIRYWRDILAEAIEFTLLHNLNIPVPLPDKSGKKVFILSHTRSDQKVSYLETTYNGRQVFSYLNYDTNHIVANAIYILRYLPEEMKKEPVMVSF